MKIISVRETPAHKDRITTYLQKSWPEVLPRLYSDCIDHSIGSSSPLPQWYVLEKDNTLIGCAGLITNDFISRMDLYPWLAALFIDEQYRGHSFAQLLIDKAKSDARKGGFDRLYLSTKHIGYYEKYGWRYIGNGYHPWGGQSRIYEISL